MFYDKDLETQETLITRTENVPRKQLFTAFSNTELEGLHEILKQLFWNKWKAVLYIELTWEKFDLKSYGIQNIIGAYNRNRIIWSL